MRTVCNLLDMDGRDRLVTSLGHVRPFMESIIKPLVSVITKKSIVVEWISWESDSDLKQYVSAHPSYWREVTAAVAAAVAPCCGGHWQLHPSVASATDRRHACMSARGHAKRSYDCPPSTSCVHDNPQQSTTLLTKKNSPPVFQFIYGSLKSDDGCGYHMTAYSSDSLLKSVDVVLLRSATR